MLLSPVDESKTLRETIRDTSGSKKVFTNEIFINTLMNCYINNNKLLFIKLVTIL